MFEGRVVGLHQKMLKGYLRGCVWWLRGSRKEAGFWFPRYKQSSLSLILFSTLGFQVKFALGKQGLSVRKSLTMLVGTVGAWDSGRRECASGGAESGDNWEQGWSASGRQVRPILGGMREGPGEAFEGHRVYAGIITSEAHWGQTRNICRWAVRLGTFALAEGQLSFRVSVGVWAHWG